VAVFTSRERAAAQALREQRIAQLAFLAPPVGARINATQELFGSLGSPEQALTHSVSWSCSDLIASVMGMLQPWAFKLPGTGVRTPTPGPAMGLVTASPSKLANQPQILNEPAAGMDIGDWLYAGTFALTRGNVYGTVAARDRLGYPSQVELESNDKVQVRKLRDGTIEYRYGGQVQDPATVFHRSIFRLPGSVTGMSVLQYGQRSIRLGLNAEDFGNSFFEDGAHPTGVLLNDSQDEISQADAQTVKQKFVAALHGTREPVVLSGGWKYQQVQVNPTDSQFVDTQQLSDLKVCRFYRVPPEMVYAAVSGSSVTYSNVEMRALDFLSYTMQRWITWWERKLGAMLPAGQYVKFDLSPILRTDIFTRWKVNHAQIASRVMTQDEVRQGEDLPPLTAEQKAEINAVPVMPPIPKLNEGL
jgi:HK97 family phage portal protein